MRTRAFLLFAVLLTLFAICRAQTPELPSAPLPATPKIAQTASAAPCFYCAGMLCGSGASYWPASTKPSFGCGAGAMLIPLPVFIEVGVIGPQAGQSYMTGYVSVDANVALAPASAKHQPLAIAGGYSPGRKRAANRCSCQSLRN